MQGWRLTQEDAHNCLANFDENTKTAMLAVYDGHGGSEVAEYCALHLPDYVKKLPSYKDGRLGDALREAFLGFDATLITEEVVKELKMLANIDKGKTIERSNALKPRFYHDSSSSSSSSSIYSPVSDEEAHDENEADMLRADANIPIEELVAKYAKQGIPQVAATKKQKVEDSPAIRSKKANIIGKGSGSGEDGEADSNIDDMVDSSSGINKITNGHADNENNLNTEKEFNDRNSESKNNEDEDLEDKCSETDSKVNSAKEADAKVSTSSKDGEAGTSKVDDLPEAASSSTSVSSSEIQSSSSASGSVKEEKPGFSIEEPSGSGEPQPGGSGCSPSKKRSLHDFDEMDDEEDEDEDEDDIDEDIEGIEGMMDDGEEDDSDLDETDEEYEGCDSSDENSFKDEDEEDEEDECDEDDDYDHHNMIKESEEPGMDSGCTAVVALLRDRELVVANAGDSRCVLCHEGKAVDLSIDHKPEDEEEKQRIEAAGGKVTGDGRVNGGLNLSRAIGDHSYKQNADLPPEEQMITALPDIQSRTIDDEDEFLVLACDGIWNFMSSQEVVDFIRERLKDPVKQAKLSLICEEIFDYCLAPNTIGDGTGCDNMTCLIIDLQHRSAGSSKRSSDQLETSTDSTDKKNSDESEQSVKRPKLTDSSD